MSGQIGRISCLVFILAVARSCTGFTQTPNQVFFCQRRMFCSKRSRSFGNIVCSGSNEFLMPQADLERISPAEFLQRLREERKTKRLPFQEWADRLAPRGDMEEFRLNWVGNVDRHQRQLFWKLITMLCEKLAFPLKVARMVHDMIMAVQVSTGAVAHCRLRVLIENYRNPGILEWNTPEQQLGQLCSWHL
eukprot:751254-Hanusia_phi.AAC.4